MSKKMIDNDINLMKAIKHPDNVMVTEAKLAYIEAQINEMEAIMWRNRVDIIILKNLETETSAQEDEHAQKIREKIREITQMSKAVAIMKQLISELK